MRIFGIITILFLLITNCSSQYSNPIFVTTNFPTQYILEHIVGTKGKVINIVPQGASPHTYSPKPADISRVQVASCLFYVSPLLDGWAEKLPAKSFIKLIDSLIFLISLNPPVAKEYFISSSTGALISIAT